MSEISNPGIDPEMSRLVKKSWKWLMVIGVLTLLLGFVGVVMNATMTIVSILFVGFFVLFGGVIHFIDALITEGWKNKILPALIAVMYITTGILMIKYPAASAAWFTLFIGAFLLIVGGFRSWIGIQMQGEVKGWGWTVCSGVIAILLGILIFAQWPVSGLWMIGLFISLELIMHGAATIAVAFAVRALHGEMEKATA